MFFAVIESWQRRHSLCQLASLWNNGSCTTRVSVTTCSVTFATSAQAPDPRTERAPCCHLWRASSACPGWPFLHVEGHHWGWQLGLRVWSREYTTVFTMEVSRMLARCSIFLFMLTSQTWLNRWWQKLVLCNSQCSHSDANWHNEWRRCQLSVTAKNIHVVPSVGGLCELVYELFDPPTYITSKAGIHEKTCSNWLA
jgi:hypothetical protein